jgi:hypothetical protein
MRRQFALDQNFPQPIVDALAAYIIEAELVPILRIDEQLATLEDWEVLLALHHHERAWDGLITTDANMLALPRELAVLMQTKLTLVVTKESGHDPIKATGLLLAYFAWHLSAHTTGEATGLDASCRATLRGRPLGEDGAARTAARDDRLEALRSQQAQLSGDRARSARIARTGRPLAKWSVRAHPRRPTRRESKKVFQNGGSGGSIFNLWGVSPRIGDRGGAFQVRDI